jgi:hypothetical protein
MKTQTDKHKRTSKEVVRELKETLMCNGNCEVCKKMGIAQGKQQALADVAKVIDKEYSNTFKLIDQCWRENNLNEHDKKEWKSAITDFVEELKQSLAILQDNHSPKRPEGDAQPLQDVGVTTSRLKSSPSEDAHQARRPNETRLKRQTRRTRRF